MHYPCPETADFVNVHALNAEFIAISLRCGKQPALCGLSAQALDRLAHVPFLLFSLQCHDAALWQRLFDGAIDLADQAQGYSKDWAHLTAGTLAFLWALARKDRHSARLFSGCSDNWCAKLARRRLICVTNRVLQAGICPVSRIDPQSDAWAALLSAGVCRDSRVRDATAIGLFQALNLSCTDQPALASAACRIRPAAQVKR